MIVLSREDIQKLISTKEAIENVKLAFSMLSNKKIETPLRTTIKNTDGVFLFMPSYCDELKYACVKLISVFSKNKEKGLIPSPSQIILIDGTNGYPVASLDGTYVTELRTGAASGAAFDILGKKECKKGALIGTGSIAESQLKAMLAVRDLKEVAVYSLHEERCLSFVERMNKELNTNVKIYAVSSGNECVKDADLIITATTSSTPVFDGKFIKEGATISCVGTFEKDKHELDPFVLTKASKIYCDSKEAVLSESGDLIIPIKNNLISEDDITGDLGEVINNKILGRENDKEIIVFESVGVSAQDLITSKYIFDKYNQMHR